jgi:glycolate oxidase
VTEAEAVLAPRTVAEVQDLLRDASAHGRPVRLHGAPAPGEARLCLHGLDRIREIDPADLLASVEAGVRLGELRAALRARGVRFIPAESPFHEELTVGELVQLGHGNLASLKYGAARHLLLGSEVVLAGGDLLATGGRTVKNVTGYDLTRFLNGPLATFGVAVTFLLKLHPAAEATRTVVARVPATDDLPALAAALADARPAWLVWADPECQRILRGGAGSGTHLVLLGLDGVAEEVLAQVEAVRALLAEQRAEVMTEEEPASHALREWADLYGPAPGAVLLDELKIPRTSLPAFLAGFREIARAEPAGLFGKLAEGNLSARVEDCGRAAAVIDRLEGLCSATGASLSGRFARLSGRARKGPLAELEHALKERFDPAGILRG